VVRGVDKTPAEPDRIIIVVSETAVGD